MKVRTTLLGMAVAATISASPLYSASNALTGSIAGVVANTIGTPQMGATVTLFNRLERQVARTMTDEHGIFQFEFLPSDMYSIRVTLASFMPALRDNIGVQPGVRKVLAINLATVLSTIELVYSLPVQQALMSDDWKWTLRGSLATRPILRVLAQDARDPMRHMRSGQGMFSHTRGMLQLSAGDSIPAPTLGGQPDLGTAFALATSFLGNNNVEIAGNLGYASQSGNPAAGFRTTFSRQNGDIRSPEVAVTMRQVIGGNVGTGIATGRSGNLPILRTLSIGMNDRLQVSDDLLFTYGGTLESVSFLDRVNYFSPFARLTYDLDGLGVVELGYSSGLPPVQMYNRDPERQSEQAGVAMFPRVSLRDGQTHIQRTRNYEIGFRKKIGSRTWGGGIYQENVTNGALTAVGADDAFPSSNLLPDLFSTASIFNAGQYATMGYMVSVTQELVDRWNATLAYGSSGVLEAGRDSLRADTPSELRESLGTRQRHWVTMRLAGVVPTSGTRFTTSYQFMNGRGLTPGHYYLTQGVNPERGLNVQIRQPLPGLSGRAGKLEATAEIRNALAQGYQPINMANGRRMMLVHSPRALRGGLAFIF